MENCAYKGCNKQATTLAYSKNMSKIVKCCKSHAENIAKEGHPEYTAKCPNCGCWMPVN